MKFLSDILAKAGLTVDGVVTLNNTATGQTPDANDNSTKLATTAWVRTFVQPYSLPIASASVLGGIKVGSGLSINSGTGVLSVTGASAASIKSTQTFVVTEGQTVFTVTGGYTPGLMDIFVNGVYLSPNQTTATNGTTFTINDPAATGDIVDIIVSSAIFEGSATTTDQLPEGVVNLYYTNARARAAITLTTTGVSGAATYNSSTGVFNIPNYQGLVPAGGVAGDILAKVSGTNYDVTWIPNYTSQVQHIVKAGVAVTKGQAVYVSSADGTNMIVSKASNASEQTSSKTLGLVAQDLAINGQGFVVTEGLLAGLNTSTANAGDPVWLGTDGNLIFGLLNKPTAPAHLVFIGVVTRVQQNNGEIFVKVQNGFELDELHDLSVKNASDGDMIKYVASTGLWTKIAATTTNITEGTNLYYTQARFDTAFAAKSTTNLTEGTNLYYTDTRVGTYLTANSYATQSYVSTQINNLVSGAPGLLDTLDELAAALGDDPNFATTVSTALSNRLRIDIGTQGLTSTQQGYGRTNLGLGSLATLSSVANAQITDVAWSKITGTPTTISGYGITDSLVYTTSTYSNPSWITALAWSKITGAPAFITGINSSMVTTALGYTPYDATNPSGYVTSSNWAVLTGATNYNTDRTTKVSNGLAIYSAYYGGSNAPTTYDISAQYVLGGKGMEMAASWHSPSATMYFRTLRDCCDNWSPWTIMLSALNYNDYAPTKTGTGASGSWGISVTGSAGSVAWTNVTSRPTALSQFTNDLGNYGGWITGYTETDTLASVAARGATSNVSLNIRTGISLIKSDGSTTGGQLFYDSSINQLYLWNSITGGYFSIYTNGGERFKIAADGTTTNNGHQILHAGNYTSYSPSLTGSGASGTWGINISGTAAVASIATDLNAADGTQINFNNVTNTDYSTMTFMSRAWSAVQGANGLAYNFTTHNNAGGGGYGALQIYYGEGGYVAAPTSFRAPIFYDSNDTGYYGDFASTSRMNNLVLGSYYQPSYTGQLILGHTSYNFNFANGSWSSSVTAGILANCADQWEFAIHDSGDRVASAFFFQGSSTNRILMGRDLGWGPTYIEAASSFRAPIFYDSNDTSYYVDPNSTSNLYRLNMNERITLGTFPNSTSNSGAAWIGRAADRNNGTMTVQLGGGSATDRRFEVVDYAWSVVLFNVNSDGNVFANSSFRAPIFYDSENTAYYLDPNSGSVLNNLRLNGSLYMDISAGGNSTTIFLTGDTASHYIKANSYWIDFVGNANEMFRWYNSSYSYYSMTLNGSNNLFVRGDIYVNGNGNSTGSAVIHAGNIGSQAVNQSNYSTMDYIMSGRNFPDGTLIQTSINYQVTYGEPFVLEIKGNAYGNGMPIDIQVQGYIYADTIINIGSYSNGSNISGLRAINYNGNLCFWFPSQGYWHGYTVKAYTAYDGRQMNRVTSISNSGLPTTAKQVDFNPSQSLRTDNAPYAANMNQYVRTSDSVSFSQITNSGALGSNSGNARNHFTQYNSGTTTPATGWITAAFGDASNNRVVIGQWNGNTGAIIGSHTGSLNDWAGLSYIATNHYFYANANYTGTVSMLIDSSHNVTVRGDVTAYSDIRVKENIVTVDNALQKTLSLRGVYYNRTDTADKRKKIGVIAQEVQTVAPELVTRMEDDMLNVSYGNMAGLFIEAIKEQQLQIESQKSEIEELKDLVKQLINR